MLTTMTLNDLAAAILDNAALVPVKPTTGVLLVAGEVDVVLGGPRRNGVFSPDELKGIVASSEVELIEVVNPVAAGGVGMDVTWIMVQAGDAWVNDAPMNGAATLIAGRTVYGDAMVVPARTLARI